MSTRAEVLARRTYSRKKDDGAYESWTEIIDRVTRHQAWLWGRARRCSSPEDVFAGPSSDPIADAGRVLDGAACAELRELRRLMLARAALLAGRTLWLGGTPTARRRESSQFNCAYVEIETVFDAVDAFWLLLQGCGVGFKPVPGCLYGFTTYIPKLTIIPSTRGAPGGSERNVERYEPAARRWTIQVGDSAEAWAKSLGKLVAGKHYGCQELVMDFSEIRPAGSVIQGYGWACQGFAPFAEAYRSAFQILNQHAGKMLPFAAIHDLLNLTGTVLSNRRSAQIALCNYGDENWREFAAFKRDYYKPEVNRPWREQSNNSLDFHVRPARAELEEIFRLMLESGGSEPGFRNAAAARRRAPWARGTNPCGEILLPNRGFCNLSDVNVAHPEHRSWDDLMRTLWLIARANYRQTCVNLEDGILQRAWHENNENLRLCGVGLTGIVQRSGLTPDRLAILRSQAREGANSMADELEMPRPAAVTTVKPSGTVSKVMDCAEGMHRPLGRHIFNHVEFGALSSLPPKLAKAGYDVLESPTRPGSLLVRFPVAWEGIEFDRLPDGREGNLESAVSQLERYRKLLKHWCDHNVSSTISYAPEEVPAIIDWFEENWDDYVAVSFLFRADPQRRAKDLGYAYLPQEVVTREEYEAYVSRLGPVDLDGVDVDLLEEAECAAAGCPAR
jgi:ribonucleoside-triphosphate reductase